MSSVAPIIVSILGLALLMVVHESGHLLAARAFGMRVTTFSIGFGPTFFKVAPEDGYFWFTSMGGKVRLRLGKHIPEKHGPTVYQVAMIPFLAYVQIAGMNPFEDQDPDDAGSYANASLWGRIITIFGGPLANYLFASVLYFLSFYYGGVIDPKPPDQAGTVVTVDQGFPAAEGGLVDGDQIVEVAGVSVSNWKAMAEVIMKHPEEKIPVTVLRGDKRIRFEITPKKVDVKTNENDAQKTKQETKQKGVIGVRPLLKRREASAAEAAERAVTEPAFVVRALFVHLGRVIRRVVTPELGGPMSIVKYGARMMKRGAPDYLEFIGMLSAYLGAFNLIPFPALDGGRLMFLGYELTTRRRANAQIEAHIHIVGLVMLLGLMVYVTMFGRDDLNLGGGK